MKKIVSIFGLTLFICTILSAQNNTQKVLFIRGGSGTVGFLEGGSDEQAADITNYMTNGGNHGWGTLADTLTNRGFVLEQMLEGPSNNNTPIDLANMDLSQYAVIVFGSNNANYNATAVDSFYQFILNGGGALFISDANFGSDWSDASDSDQQLLTPFGWTMNQDNGTYSLETNDFNEPNHPILAGVSKFDGEGVTPITFSDTLAEVSTTILVAVPSNRNVRRNDSDNQGSTTGSNPNDAVLIVAEVGEGRIAGHYDRNTFFNINGAGTNITRFDNAQYAVNLFTWLADSVVVDTNQRLLRCNELEQTDFENGAGEWTYSDNLFRNTNEATYASGFYLNDALQTTVGGVNNDDITDMSGGWTFNFELLQEDTIRLMMNYDFEMNDGYEQDEFTEFLISIDGNFLGQNGTEYIARLEGGGSLIGQTLELILPDVSAGEHSINIGLYNNKKTHNDEFSTLKINDISLTIPLTINKWIGGAGLWTDGSKWSLGLMPEECHQVVISAVNENDMITIDADMEISIVEMHVESGQVFLGENAILHLNAGY